MSLNQPGKSTKKANFDRSRCHPPLLLFEGLSGKLITPALHPGKQPGRSHGPPRPPRLSSPPWKSQPRKYCTPSLIPPGCLWSVLGITPWFYCR